MRSTPGPRWSSTRRSSPSLKIDLARRISDQLDSEKGKVPIIDPAFEPLPEDPVTAPTSMQLQVRPPGPARPGATHAFSPSFLIAAAAGPDRADPDRLGEEESTCEAGGR